MRAFVKVESIAAPLPMMNVDTDMIIPKQFLKTIKRTGLGQFLFYELRFDMNNNEVEDFVLNKSQYKNANILVAQDNFGCGSSREHAPWALLDFGITCIIAPSFADIFYNNCFKNGILPIKLPQNTVDDLMEKAQNLETFKVDLESQKVIIDNEEYEFEIDAFRKKCLLQGLDDIGLTLEKTDQITAFENKQKQLQPWLYKA